MFDHRSERVRLVAMMTAMLAIPVLVWIYSDGRYKFIEERAGGVHFVTKVNRFDAEDACLILDPGLLAEKLVELSCTASRRLN